jgi:hypothetical protein
MKTMRESPEPGVDMSSEAIERRLAQVGALYQLMVSLRTAEVAPAPVHSRATSKASR